MFKKDPLDIEFFIDDIGVLHTSQINDNTCVHACVSMVTGKPIEDIIQSFPEHRGLSRIEAISELASLGIGCIPIHDAEEFCYHPGIYFVSVPSLNRLGTAHQIVVVSMVEEGDATPVVLDPNARRLDAAEFYDTNALEPTSKTKHLLSGRFDINKLFSFTHGPGLSLRKNYYLERTVSRKGLLPQMPC